MASIIVPDFPFTPAMWGYGIAAFIYATFAIQFSAGWRGGVRATALVCAVISSALWSAAVLASLAFQSENWWWWARIVDAVRSGAWLAFLLLLMGGGPRLSTARSGRSLLPWVSALSAALLLVGALFPQAPPWIVRSNDHTGVFAFYAALGASVIGLALTEQLFRRTPQNRRWAIKPLIIGLGGMFALDLLIYSSAVLFRQQDPDLWATRGIAHGLVIFFIAIATARNASWTINLYVSREVVFNSTAFLIAGAYLLIVAAAGYWVRFFGGAWGRTLQVTFVFVALMALVSLALSGSLRSRLRVYIGKNLFTHRYDYRTEWLRFTRLLATSAAGEVPNQQVVHAFADLVESNGGALWLERSGAYFDATRSNLDEVTDSEPTAGSLATFLARTGWIVRLDEFAKSPDRYPNLVLPAWLSSLRNAWLVIPLQNGSELIGFVVLARPRTFVDVNWEVLDLLKTASCQAASYLAQILAKEALVETEKFDAFNRMSAFVIHDLKNLVTQLALLLRNAERHRDNPEFQRDMLGTIENVVARMNHLMLQLRTGTTPMEKARPIELEKLVERILTMKASGPLSIETEISPNLRALAHDDRIERVIGHIVQNAIEASEASGPPVKLRTSSNGKFAVIEVSDCGVGMSEEFIRQRLFHPFQTTKSQGMGIGMYESFQYITGIGGRITVESTLGHGARFKVFLPLAEPTVAPNPMLRKVA